MYLIILGILTLLQYIFSMDTLQSPDRDLALNGQLISMLFRFLLSYYGFAHIFSLDKGQEVR